MPTRRAMYPSTCKLCRKAIRGQSRPFANDGQEVSLLSRVWVHASCLERKLEQTAARTELPEARGDADAPSVIGRTRKDAARIHRVRHLRQPRQGGGKFGWGPKA